MRLIESAGTNSLEKFSGFDLGALLRLLGGSAYLSEIVIREGKNGPRLFLRQIRRGSKTASTHLRTLSGLLREGISFEEASELFAEG